MIIRKSPKEIEQMERAARVVVETLELLGERVKPGVTTQELDTLAEEFIRSHGGVPKLSFRSGGRWIACRRSGPGC